MAGSFLDGVFFVDLALLSEPDEVPAQVASSIGMTYERTRDMADTVIEVLSPASVLLLFDNFEHVTEAAPFVASLLAGCPQVKALATSRIPLHVRGEHLFPVEPLALPAGEPTFEEIVSSPAVGLFRARALQAKPDFTMTPDNAPAVAEICDRLDGLPLAIELTAPAIRMFSPTTLAERVQQGLVSFTGDVDLPERQHTLRATIDWSYRLLGEREQRMLAQLSVFVGGFTLEAAGAVCGDGEEPDVMERLASLIDKSLVAIEEDIAGQTRFRLLETIHLYAAERFCELDDTEQVLDRHTRFFVELCRIEGREIRTIHHRNSLLRVTAEWPNITAMLDRAIERGDAGAAVAFYHIWIHSWITCESAPFSWWVWVHEAVVDRDQLERVLPPPDRPETEPYRSQPSAGVTPLRELSNEIRARFLFLLGAAWTEFEQVDLSDATRALSQAEALFRQLGDATGQADAEAFQGIATISNDEARAHFENAQELYQETGDLWGTALVCYSLGFSASLRGDPVEADRLMSRAIELAQSIGSDHLVGMALGELGMVALAKGDLEVARTALSEAAELLLGIYNREGLADTLGYFAALALHVGDPQAAAVFIGAADAIRNQTGFFATVKTNPAFEQIHSDTCNALGDEAFDTAFEEGASLSPRQAIERALERFTR